METSQNRRPNFVPALILVTHEDLAANFPNVALFR